MSSELLNDRIETTTSCVTGFRNSGFERCYTQEEQTTNSDCILMGAILIIHTSLSTYALPLAGFESAYNTKTYILGQLK